VISTDRCTFAPFAFARAYPPLSFSDMAKLEYLERLLVDLGLRLHSQYMIEPALTSYAVVRPSTSPCDWMADRALVFAADY